MLTIEQCRKLIPEERNKVLTDEQVEEIRNDLYGLAELALESYFKRGKSKKNSE